MSVQELLYFVNTVNKVFCENSMRGLSNNKK